LHVLTLFIGQLVAQEQPLAHCLNSEYLATHCSNCLSSPSSFLSSLNDSCPSQLLRCGGCKTLHYCSSSCQQQDWKNGHRQECQHLCNFPGTKVPPLSIRFLARLLFRCQQDNNALMNRIFKSFVSHRQDMDTKKMEPIGATIVGLCQYLNIRQAPDLHCSSQQLVELACIMSCNSMSLTDDASDNVGACLMDKCRYLVIYSVLLHCLFLLLEDFVTSILFLYYSVSSHCLFLLLKDFMTSILF
jgi:hypothetical protein